MEIIFEFSIAEVVQFVVAVLLPVLVGLVTTRVTSANRKSILLFALSGISAFLNEVLVAANSGAAFDLGAALLLFLTTFIIAVAMHYGLWKPTGVSEIAQDHLVAKG